MIQAKCIQKFRDKSGKIIGYKLQDNNGQIKELSATDVKNAIKQGKINIVNLQLTTDNRLIDKNTNSTRDKEENNKRSSLACISENLVPVSSLALSLVSSSAARHNLITKFLMEYIINTAYYDEDTETYRDNEDIVSKRMSTGKKIYQLLSKLDTLNIPNIFYFNKNIYINTTRVVSKANGEALSNECYRLSECCSDFIYIDGEYVEVSDTYCDVCEEIEDGKTIIKAAFEGGGIGDSEIIFTLLFSDGTEKTYQVYEDDFREYDNSLSELSNITDMSNVISQDIIRLASKLIDLVLLNTQLETQITINGGDEDVVFDKLADKYYFSDSIKDLSLYIMESEKEITYKMIENLTIIILLGFDMQ